MCAKRRQRERGRERARAEAVGRDTQPPTNTVRCGPRCYLRGSMARLPGAQRPVSQVFRNEGFRTTQISPKGCILGVTGRLKGCFGVKLAMGCGMIGANWRVLGWGVATHRGMCCGMWRFGGGVFRRGVCACMCVCFRRQKGIGLLSTSRKDAFWRTRVCPCVSVRARWWCRRRLP